MFEKISLSKVPAFERLSKSKTMINFEIERHFSENYAISGVNLDNMEQVYNPLFSGYPSQITETRTRLVQRGMDVGFADRLALKYLKGL